MAISNVSFSDTFAIWMARFNQLLAIGNLLTEGQANSTGTLTLSNAGNLNGGVTLNVSNGVIRVNGNTFQSNSISLVSNTPSLTIFGTGRLGTTLYIDAANLSVDVSDTSTINIASANLTNAIYNNVITVWGLTNTVFNHANVAFGVGNSAFGTTNLAFNHANVAFSIGNTAFDHANASFSRTNTVYTHANSAFSVANTAFDHANASFSQTNTVYTHANSAFGVGNTAFDHANAAFAQANTANANSAKLNVEQTWTAKQTYNELLSLMGAADRAQISNTALSGTLNFDTKSYAVYWSTANATGNWTLNVRGDSSTTLNSRMSTGEVITIHVVSTQGSTAYYNNSFQIDGASVTPKWMGGAPTAGKASSIELYQYKILKTGDAAFSVLATKVAFT